MNITVRKYQEEDLEKVNELLQEAFSVTKNNFTDDNYQEIVVCVDNEVAGYALLTKIFNPIKEIYYVHVDYVCVKEKYRGLGLGKELMNYIDKVAKEMGVSYLELTCSRFRIAAHKLYENCNYIKRDSDIYRKDII